MALLSCGNTGAGRGKAGAGAGEGHTHARRASLVLVGSHELSTKGKNMALQVHKGGEKRPPPASGDVEAVVGGEVEGEHVDGGRWMEKSWSDEAGNVTKSPKDP